MRNRAMKRMIAILLCLVVFAGSELSGLTNIVGDLFAEETTADADIDTREKTVEPVDVEAQPEKEESTTGNMDDVISRTEDLQTSENSLPDSSDGAESTESPDTSGETDNTEQPSGTEDAQKPEQDDSGSGVTEEPEETDPADENKEDNTSEKPDGAPQTPAEQAPKEEESAILETPTDEAPEEGIKTPQEESEVPAEDAEEEEPEKEWEYDESMDLETFESLGEDEVGEILLEEAVSGGPRRARSRAAANPGWNFRVHYVNQNDDYDVTKNDDFTLKYQMEFRNATGEELKVGSVEIRIPASLFTKRDGTLQIPDQIAVPKKDSGTAGSTAFKYYIDETTNDLVFYNEKPIATGTNSMWQVLYKVTAMDVPDLTEWELQPSVTVTTGEGEDETTKELGEDDLDPLIGLLDTYVRIDSFQKTPYKETNRRYTPGLYTESQVAAYLENGELPKEFSGDNFANYRYVVWEMTVRGSATQPWSFSLEELPAIAGADGTECFVVGYKDRSNASLGYDKRITAPAADADLKNVTLIGGENTERSFGSRFWVVTAYPIGQVTVGTNLTNQATAVMNTPADSENGAPAREQSSTASWTYDDYRWDYRGDTLYLRKHYSNNPEKDNTYSGWLDVYRRASEKDQDYGDFPFRTNASLYGYQWTHQAVKDSEGGRVIGDRIEGNSFNLITADDTMYAHIGDEAVWMGPEDYYFSEITVSQTDRDMDLVEDKEVDPEHPGTLKVYVMYGLEEDGSTIIKNNSVKDFKDNDWEPIYEEPLTGSSVQKTFRLSDEVMARQPWRVKAEYVSEGYVSACQLDVKVRFRHDAPALAEVRNPTGDPIKEVQLEDVSGAVGEYLENNQLKSTIYVTADDSVQDNVDKTYRFNYDGRQDLISITQKLYGDYILRSGDDKTLTNLQPKAEAYKASVSTNDSDNDRVLVDYCLTAYDGYQLYGQDALPWLTDADKELLTPGQKEVVFYDLLPYGMTYDPSVAPVAGRITELDARGYYRTRSDLWVKSQVQVRVSPEDVITDYKGTGRTRVAFHVSYEGADPTVYTNGMWMEGWGVRFRAFYAKKDLQVVQAGANVCAFMPENRTSSLVGQKGTEVFLDNGNFYPNDFTEADKALGADINSDKGADVDKNIYNVMYARNVATGDFVQSSESGLGKAVKADADSFGSFSKSAKVVPEGGYTYEITLACDGSYGALRNVIVCDQLEKATAEGTTVRGSFRRVITDGLERLGITPRIYYSTNPDAATPKTRAELQNSVDWTTAEAWGNEDNEGNPTGVRAVAVDLGDYKLQSGSNVSFQIAMKLPGGAKEGDVLRNEAVYAALTESDKVLQERSNPTTVTVAPFRTVEVIKTFADGAQIPASVRSSSFRFRLYEKTTDVKKPRNYLGGQSYTLYQKSDTSADGWEEIESNYLHATDAEGRFTLRADEKAVFRYADIYQQGEAGVPNSGGLNIHAEEEEEIFWQSQTGIIDNSNEENGKREITITNAYRPILYVEKLLQGVAGDEELRGNAETQTFTFRIETQDESGQWQPLANTAYYYVDRAGLSGGLPGPDGKHGDTLEKCLHTTDGEGRFAIQKGDVVAICFDKVGIPYRVSELTTEADGKALAQFVNKEGETETLDWICQTAPRTGTTAVSGTRASITNTWRFKELWLTKKITHQEPEDYKDTKFTFQLLRRTTGADGKEVWNPLAPEELKRVRWRNANGALAPSDVGDKWTLLGEDGKITAALGGQTIRIYGLESGAVYKVKEIYDENGDYRPDQEEVIVTMPTFGEHTSAVVTNDWLWRPLYVTKTVAYDPENKEDADAVKEAEFRFTAAVGETKGKETLLVSGNTSLAGKEVTYDLMEQGKVVTPGLKTDKDGVFTLKNGQTAVFKDAAKVDWSYSVTELHESRATERFQQIYPPIPNGELQAPATGSFGTEGAEVGVVNGSNNNLYISKNYVYDPEDTAAERYLQSASMLAQANQSNQNVLAQAGQSMLAQANQSNQSVLSLLDQANQSMLPQDTEEDASAGDTSKTLRKTRHAVKVSLILNGEPLAPCEVTVIGADGSTYTDQWTDPDAEDTLDAGVYLLEPNTTVIIPASVLDQYRQEGKELSYELTELEDYRHRLEVFSYTQKGDEAAGTADTPVRKLIEINQKLPADDASVTGTVEQNPVASVTNEVVSHDIRSQAGKQMTWNSSEVPEGAKLVWRVERKTEGGWVPAAGISYAAFQNVKRTLIVTRPNGSQLEKLTNDLVAVTGSLQSTGADGKIELYKVKDGDPLVIFPENEVWLNLNSQGQIGELRLVEVMEDSDPAWGMLVGYTPALDDAVSENTQDAESSIRDTDMSTGMMKYSSSDTGTESTSPEAGAASGTKRKAGVNRAGDDAAGLDVSEKMRNRRYRLSVGEKDAGVENRLKMAIFYNSNVPKPVEIAKEMKDNAPSDQLFTMVLEQVLLLTNNDQRTYATDLSSVTPQQILMTEGRAGIRYTVYSQESETELRSASTGPGGTIQLRAGEYARLNLPEGTLWTLTEQQPATFEKPDLQAEGTTYNRLWKTGDNLMLIYQTETQQPEPELELRVTVKKQDIYLEDIRHNYLLDDGEPYRFYLNWGDCIDATLGDEMLQVPQALTISGTYTDQEVLKALAESTGKEPVPMHYTATFTDQETGKFYSADFELTYHPPRPITITRDIVDTKSVYNEGGDPIMWEPDENGLLRIPEFVRESPNGPLCRVTQLGELYETPGGHTEEGVFYDNDKIQKVIIPDGVKKIGEDAFYECKNLTEVELPKGLTTIGYGAFGNCSTLKIMNLPDGLTTIGRRTFISCGLQNVEIPEGVTEIPSSAFESCKSLETITIPGSATSIGANAFWGCTNLKKVTISEGVRNIDGAFWNCRSLVEITVPSTVTTIREDSFQNCSALQSIYIRKTQEETTTWNLNELCSNANKNNPPTVYFLKNDSWVDSDGNSVSGPTQ